LRSKGAARRNGRRGYRPPTDACPVNSPTRRSEGSAPNLLRGTIESISAMQISPSIRQASHCCLGFLEGRAISGHRHQPLPAWAATVPRWDASPADVGLTDERLILGSPWPPLVYGPISDRNGASQSSCSPAWVVMASLAAPPRNPCRSAGIQLQSGRGDGGRKHDRGPLR